MTTPPHPLARATAAFVPTLHSSGYQTVCRTVQVTHVGGGPRRTAVEPAAAASTRPTDPVGGVYGGSTTVDHVWIPLAVSPHDMVSSWLTGSRDQLPVTPAAVSWVTELVPSDPSGHGPPSADCFQCRPYAGTPSSSLERGWPVASATIEE